MSGDAPREPSPARRTLRWTFLLSIALTLFTAAVVRTGQWGPIMLVLILPPAFVAYFVVLLGPVWLFLHRTSYLRVVAVALGIALVYPIVAYLAPELFQERKPFVPRVQYVTAADFTAPWGARMIALDIAAIPGLNRRAERLWVAETPLTRGEYARILGKEAGADGGLPLTALTRAQLDAVLAAMNGAPKPGAPRGRFHVPEFHEADAYMHSRTQATYVARCDQQLDPAAQRPADEFGLRGILDNAAEIIFMSPSGGWTGPRFCAAQGGVDPYCTNRGPAAQRVHGLAACEDQGADVLWNHPVVGIRVVYGEDVYDTP